MFRAGSISVVQHLPSVPEAMGSSPTGKKREREGEKEGERCVFIRS